MKKFLISAFLLLTFGITFCYAGKLSSYPFTAVMQNGDFFPIVVLSGDTNANINWSNLKVLIGSQVSNINWQANALLSQGLNGVNWQSINPVSGAVNWQIFANGATTGTIWCTKSNGQPGKCTTSISGTACTSCL